MILILHSCSKEPHDYEKDRTTYFTNLTSNYNTDSLITCLTYNIQLGFKANQDPWNADEIGGTDEQLGNLITIIDSITPTVIALQEVPRNRYNTKIKNYIEAISERLDINYAFGSHGYNDPEGIYPVHGEWGNVILSKYEILEIKNIEVSYANKWKKRSILDATLKLNDTLTIHAISIHYDLTMKEYNDGLQNTMSYIETITEPIILMGDFNPQFGVQQLDNDLISIGLMDSDSSYIHGADRIFYSKEDFRSCCIGSYYDTVNWTSDHPANYSILKIMNTAANKW